MAKFSSDKITVILLWESYRFLDILVQIRLGTLFRNFWMAFYPQHYPANKIKIQVFWWKMNEAVKISKSKDSFSWEMSHLGATFEVFGPFIPRLPNCKTYKFDKLYKDTRKTYFYQLFVLFWDDQ